MTTDNRDLSRERYIETVATHWHRVGGGALMEGRVLAFLFLSDEEAVSSADLAQGIGASQGSISESTRALTAGGIVRKVRVPGDRSHYFVVSDDPMGEMLRAGVPEILAWQKALRPDSALVPHLGDRVLTRLGNVIDYYTWINGRSESLAAEWEAYKSGRRSADPAE